MDGKKKTSVEFTHSELVVLGLLVGLGASAFDAPAGPAYALKRRLEERFRFMITDQDIINVLKKIKDAGPT